jgi:sec-independent protein translocase protein TatC
MASALDDDTRRTLAEGRETAGAMLRAAQKDLQKVFVVFLIGFLGGFYALNLYVWDFLKDVTYAQMDAAVEGETSIIAQTPFDVILLQAKIALVLGVVLCLPVFVYYSRDALEARGYWPSSPVAPWKLVTGAGLVGGLFAVGVAYGYLIFFPFVFDFLAGNAVASEFTPTYSIVKWAEFIFLLTISFGLAAQMPLAITGLSYAEIVPYETFREKWRYAVVGIFVFGALFSPPDPFTQIMWAVPLLALYGASLYLAKVVVTARRGSERIDLPGALQRRWNLLAGAFVAGLASAYYALTRVGVGPLNDAIAPYSDSRVPNPLAVVPLPADAAAAVWGLVVGAAVALLALGYVVYREIEVAAPSGPARPGDPAGIDLSTLDAAGIRAAPPEAFATLTEEQAVAMAGDAMDAGNREKARAILDRFDEDGDRAIDPRDDAGDGRAPSGPAPAGTWTRTAETPLAAVSLGRDRVDWSHRLATRWNLPLFVGTVAALAVYVAYATGLPTEGVAASLPALDGVGAAVGLGGTALVYAVAGGAAVALAVATTWGYALVAAYRAGTDPTAVDATTLSAEELRTAPAAFYAGLSESAATMAADRVMAAGDRAAARAILDRWDAVNGGDAGDTGDGDATDDGDSSELEDRATRAGGVLAEGLTDGEADEDDIGGYYDDVAFVLDSITSKSFRIVAVFATVLAVTFGWLYTGGIGQVRANFLGRLPEEVLPSNLNVVALHPVEVLIFEVKFSTLVAALAILPMLAYYAWPALRDRDIVRGNRTVIFGWTAALLIGLAGGSYLGYTVVAPNVISWLVADAVGADMIVAYRITNFFWLIFFTTAGIGLLADVPILMLLLNTAGVGYRSMRGRWREVTVGILAVAALFTPASITTMFLATVPLMTAYGIGLAALFVVTLGGRRDLAPGNTSEA